MRSWEWGPPWWELGPLCKNRKSGLRHFLFFWEMKQDGHCFQARKKPFLLERNCWESNLESQLPELWDINWRRLSHPIYFETLATWANQWKPQPTLALPWILSSLACHDWSCKERFFLLLLVFRLFLTVRGGNIVYVQTGFIRRESEDVVSDSKPANNCVSLGQVLS